MELHIKYYQTASEEIHDEMLNLHKQGKDLKLPKEFQEKNSCATAHITEILITWAL